jgi:hypothetical protein
VEFDLLKKTIDLFERHCHVTEKSEAIACARRSRSSRLTRCWTKKRIIGKIMRAEKEERHKGPLTQKAATRKWKNLHSKCFRTICGKPFNFVRRSCKVSARKKSWTLGLSRNRIYKKLQCR